jgi:hypothetical protein
VRSFGISLAKGAAEILVVLVPAGLADLLEKL